MISEEQRALIEAALESVDNAIGQTWRDGELIVNAQIALKHLIDTDKAERAERAKPIDAEWLLSIEFDDKGGWVGKFVGGADLWYGKLRGDVGINMHFLPSITTRGQLLDLLAALKGGEVSS